MSKKVLILLADGFEEIEAVTIIDILRRAELQVTTAGVSGKTVMGAHQLKVEADIELSKYKETPDAVVLPGGMPGSQNLAESSTVAEIVRRVHSQKKVVGAICAAPALALSKHGVLEGRKATCYPGFEKYFPASVKVSKDRVVIDENVITSQGPGSAMEFALELVKQLADSKTSAQLKEGLLAKI